MSPINKKGSEGVKRNNAGKALSGKLLVPDKSRKMRQNNKKLFKMLEKNDEEEFKDTER